MLQSSPARQAPHPINPEHVRDRVVCIACRVSDSLDAAWRAPTLTSFAYHLGTTIHLAVNLHKAVASARRNGAIR